MTTDTTTSEIAQPVTETTPDCPDVFESWVDPLESMIRERIRGLIEELINDELDVLLARPRYGRRAADIGEGAAGHRHGRRTRTLMGTFGKTEITVPAGAVANERWADQRMA